MDWSAVLAKWRWPTPIPDQYNAVAELRPGLPAPADERQLLGFDHHMIGSELLRRWGLPEVLVLAVRDWSLPGDADVSNSLCQIVQIADDIATVICTETKGEAYVESHELSSKYFGLSAGEVDDFVLTLKEEVESLANILDVEVDNQADYSELLDTAKQQMVEIAMATNFEVEDLRERETELVTQAEVLQRAAQMDG